MGFEPLIIVKLVENIAYLKSGDVFESYSPAVMARFNFPTGHTHIKTVWIHRLLEAHRKHTELGIWGGVWGR